MRILHWYPNYLEGGGVAIATIGLAHAQAAQGAEVIVACADHRGPALYEPIEDSPVEIVRWRSAFGLQLPPFRGRVPVREDRDSLRALRPDLVHIHGVFLPDNHWIPSIFEVPVLLSPHGGFHPVVFHKNRRFLKRAYLAVGRRLLYDRVQMYHALDPSEQEHIERALPGRPVTCIPQGPNMGTQRQALPMRARRPGAPIRFVFVGRLHVYTKGLDLMLQAFARARRELPDVETEMMLVGPDWEGSVDRLQRLAEELGVRHALTFTGPVPASQVNRLLHESDVYVQLSRHEGFSLSIAEALLAGRPAILSDAVGTVSYPEFKSFSHVDVVPVDVEAAARSMVRAARDIDTLHAAARSHLNDLRHFFSWERAARMTLDLAASMVHGRTQAVAA